MALSDGYLQKMADSLKLLAMSESARSGDWEKVREPLRHVAGAKGNVLDLAVAVVIGAAFGNVINAFVRDLLTPLIAAIGGQPDFSALSFTVNNSRFLYGDFLNALISFLIVGAAVYFFVVAPVNRLMAAAEARERSALLRPHRVSQKRCLSSSRVG